MEFLTPIGQKIIKATAKEETPTPGYMFVELANHSLTEAKDLDVMQKCLLKRAASNDAMIKYKTFVVIKQLCLKGNPLLKRAFSRGAQVIKDALQYKGRPHPLRGDKPNQNVRDAAKAALSALYSQTKQAKTRKMEGFGGGRGIGSGALGSSGSGGTGSTGSPGSRSPTGGGGYGGGNVSPRSGTVMGPATSNKYGRGIGSSGSMELGRKRPEDHIRDGIHKAVSGLKTFGKQMETYAKKATNDFNKAVGLPQKHGSDYGFSSNRGANALQSSDYSSPTVAGIDRTVNRATSDGSFERSVISDLVAPSGMSNVPDMEKLARFLKRCETLSESVVGPILEEKMRSGEFKVVCKALVTVHAILEQDNLSKFHQYFKQHQQVLHDLCGDKAAIAKKAQRVLETLETISVQQQQPSVDEQDDGGFDFEGGNDGGDMFAEMDGGDDDMFADMDGGGDDMFAGMDGVDDSAGGGGFDFDEGSAPAPALPAASAEDDFFGGGSAAPAPAPAPSSSVDDLISNLDFSPSPAPMGGMNSMGGGMGGMNSMGNANSGGGSDLSGLDFMSAPSPAPAPAPAPSSGGMDDLFGNLGGSPSPAPAPVPAPAVNDDPFAGL